MTSLLLSSGLFTHADETAEKLAESLGLALVTDKQIIDETATTYLIKKTTLDRVIEGKSITFNDFTHEKERCLACLKKTLALHVEKGNCLFTGFMGHLIPAWVTHIMRVLIIADKKHRIAAGVRNQGLSEKEASSRVNQADKRAILWTKTLFDKNAWDETLYDIVIPSNKMDVENALALINEHQERFSHMPVDLQKREAEDFSLTADVSIALSGLGGELTVSASNGDVNITIEKNILMLNLFKQKISKVAHEVPGVRSVATRIGKNYYKTNIIHNFEFEKPFNVLLVDDEKEFVQTLSERLQMRQVRNDVVYSGEEALAYADRQDTEVMVLDLKMPGIDGFEVLRQIKTTKPDMEVIILTGHGSEEDKKRCMDLGAFAYLQKPADIDLLTKTMHKAYEKINLNKNTPAIQGV